MKTYRLRFVGDTTLLVVFAVLTLPFASLPAFLYFLYHLQVDCHEQTPQAT